MGFKIFIQRNWNKMCDLPQSVSVWGIEEGTCVADCFLMCKDGFYPSIVGTA